MVRIELLELNEDVARYKFFPESSKEYGIVTLKRKTGERIWEKLLDAYTLSYAAHAISRVEEYQKSGDFKEQDLIAWY